MESEAVPLYEMFAMACGQSITQPRSSSRSWRTRSCSPDGMATGSGISPARSAPDGISIGGTYDRLIPRRLLEEAGAPRMAFGQQKKGRGYSASLGRQRYSGWCSRSLRRGFLQSAAGRVEPPPVCSPFNDMARKGIDDETRAKSLLSSRKEKMRLHAGGLTCLRTGLSRGCRSLRESRQPEGCTVHQDRLTRPLSRCRSEHTSSSICESHNSLLPRIAARSANHAATRVSSSWPTQPRLINAS